MIQNFSSITKMLKLVYFTEQRPKTKNINNFSTYRPSRNTKYTSQKFIQNPDLIELLSLLSSSENCQNWLFLIQKYKDHFIVQQKLYHCIMNSTVNVHNLFLMMIQCKVLSTQIWIPIEKLCQLQGDRQNELCCLVHFNVMNMGKKHELNPPTWSAKKANRQLSDNFMKVYNRSDMGLKEKVSILPMLIVLSKKNAKILWSKLPWLYTFPANVLEHLKGVMRRILLNGLSETVAQMDTDYFMSKVCIKAIQLLEVEGFISTRGLFSYAYELFNITSILELLCDFTLSYSQKEQTAEEELVYASFKEQIGQFIGQILSCVGKWEYEFLPIHANSENKDLLNLQTIIVLNSLYLEQLGVGEFSIQYQTFLDNICSNPDNQTNQIQSLSKILPSISSSLFLSQSLNIPYSLLFPEWGSNSTEQNLNNFINQEHYSILTLVLLQLYNLRMDYLPVLLEILSNAAEIVEEAWSQNSSTFHKIQLYLQRNHLLEFLIWNFNAIQTKNDISVMFAYYKVLGLMLKANPICYGIADRVLKQMENDRERQRDNKGKGNRIPLLEYFTTSFVTNVSVSKHTIFVLLADQFEWKQNQSQAYQNSSYNSIFVEKVIDSNRNLWMVKLIEGICLMHVNTRTEPKIKNEDEKYEWITLVLLLYYYFQETLKLKNKKSVLEKSLKAEKCQGINVPNRAYFDQIFDQQKFMQKLYPIKIKLPGECANIQKNVPSSKPSDISCYTYTQGKSVRILTMLLSILDQWQQHFNMNSKYKILGLGFNYSILRVWKKKLRNRISGFVKTKEFEQQGFQ